MKFYFREDDDERCFLKKDIIQDMKDSGIKELKIFEAERELELANGYFWCTEYQEIGETKDCCGKFCDLYKPRNGKNGRCRFSGHCYEPTEKCITLKLYDNKHYRKHLNWQNWLINYEKINKTT